MNTPEKKLTLDYCPNCGGGNLGKLNWRNYFCRECFVELAITTKKQVYVHFPSEDGTIARKTKVQ